MQKYINDVYGGAGESSLGGEFDQGQSVRPSQNT